MAKTAAAMERDLERAQKDCVLRTRAGLQGWDPWTLT